MRSSNNYKHGVDDEHPVQKRRDYFLATTRASLYVNYQGSGVHVLLACSELWARNAARPYDNPSAVIKLTDESNEQGTAHSTPRRRSHDGTAAIEASLSPTISRDEDTAVPLEGRILRDAQGKVIFIGDCAPLSFLQTVRHLIASAVDADALPPQSSRDSIIEVARPGSADQHQSLSVSPHEVRLFVQQYTVAVSGLVDLFEHEELMAEISSWATGAIAHPHESAAAVFYLVLAIGAQETHEMRAEAWCTYARDVLLKHLVNSMNVSTVQGFALVAIYMLRAFQPNGAYLYFCEWL